MNGASFFLKSGCVLRGVPNEVSLVERLSLCGARGGEAAHTFLLTD